MQSPPDPLPLPGVSAPHPKHPWTWRGLRPRLGLCPVALMTFTMLRNHRHDPFPKPSHPKRNSVAFNTSPRPRPWPWGHPPGCPCASDPPGPRCWTLQALNFPAWLPHLAPPPGSAACRRSRLLSKVEPAFLFGWTHVHSSPWWTWAASTFGHCDQCRCFRNCLVLSWMIFSGPGTPGTTPT